jgi:shikimate kinase
MLCTGKSRVAKRSTNVVSVYLASIVVHFFHRLNHNKSKRPLIADKNEGEIERVYNKASFDQVLLQSSSI